MRLNEKALNIIILKIYHKQLKEYAIKHDISIKKLIIQLLKKEGIIKDG